MSSIIIFLYSKYVPYIRLMLETIRKIDYIHTLCVDNELVRNIVNKSSIIKNKKVPCFIVIYPNKTVYQYIDNDMMLFLNKLITIENEKIQSAASAKSPVTDLVPEVFEQPSTNQPIPQPTPPKLTPVSEGMKPNSIYSHKSAQFKTENKGDYLDTEPMTSDLVNFSNEPKRVRFEEGNGHENMAKSSLRSNKSDELAIIEDIMDDGDSELLIKESKPSEHPLNTKKTNMKDIMNDMIAERENLDNKNTRNKPF